MDRGQRELNLRGGPLKQHGVRRHQKKVKSSTTTPARQREESSNNNRTANWIKHSWRPQNRQTDRRWSCGWSTVPRKPAEFLKTPVSLFPDSCHRHQRRSYFEKVKIHSPDGFDMMLQLPVLHAST
ncbi:cyclic GMP-AMP synthase [Lates japonicus]|uniref:Cyclic GMP-AMP synthase n=1 Tax=Lates japonicus TaxID=270547 RepID=A0AAD3M488_LATJO|nr:cyclic GMP-AMP synthase [Lates japonicus]